MSFSTPVFAMASTILSSVVSYAYPITNGLNVNKLVSNTYKNTNREIYKQWNVARQQYFLEKRVYAEVKLSRSLIDNKIEELRTLLEMTGYLGICTLLKNIFHAF